MRLDVMFVFTVWAAVTYSSGDSFPKPLSGTECATSSMPGGSKGTLAFQFPDNVQDHGLYFIYIQFNGTRVHRENCFLEDGAAKECSSSTLKGYKSGWVSGNTLRLDILHLSERTAGVYVLYSTINGSSAQPVSCSIDVQTTPTNTARSTTTTTNNNDNNDDNGISTEMIVVVCLLPLLAVAFVAVLLYFRYRKKTWNVREWFRSPRNYDLSQAESGTGPKESDHKPDGSLSGQEHVTAPMLGSNGNSRNHDKRLTRTSMMSRLGHNLQLYGKILSDGQPAKNGAKKPDFDKQLKPQTHRQEKTDDEMDGPQKACPKQRGSEGTHERVDEKRGLTNGDKTDPTHMCSTQRNADKTSSRNMDKVGAQSLSKNGNKCSTKICSTQPSSPQNNEDAMMESENELCEKTSLLNTDTANMAGNTIVKASRNTQNNSTTQVRSEISPPKIDGR